MKTNSIKKDLAINLRRKGRSIRDIEVKLGIARSTLSGWLHNIKMSDHNKKALHKRWLISLAKSREKAAETHRKERRERMEKIEQEAKRFIDSSPFNKKIAELIFSAFYLAEGAKRKGSLEISNSNPEILAGFWKLMQFLYPLNKSKIRCQLHLRSDHSEKQSKNYWSKILHIPKSQFIKSQFDKRTIFPTYNHYKGVCTIYYCDVNLQKRAIAIGEEFLKKLKTIDNLGS